MPQLPLSGPNLFILQQQFAKEGSRDALFMSSCLDGNAMSEAQRDAKAEAAKNCAWRGDSPEPEHDDLAHDTRHTHRQVQQPDQEVCIWQSDSPEPELDDLAHHSETPNADPQPTEPDNHGKPGKEDEHKEASKEHSPGDQANTHSGDNQPTFDEKKGQEPDQTTETLRGRVFHRVQHMFKTIQTLTYEKEMEIGEAKKARGEKRAKEKEERKKLKEERREARKQQADKRREQRRKEKERKTNGKEAASPPNHPPDTKISPSAHPHPHPGCRICQDPEERGVVEFMRQSLENWQGLPSFRELKDAAKVLIGKKKEGEPNAEEEPPQSISPEDQELIDHIAEHINTHIRTFLDPKSSPGANAGTDKASSYGFPAHAAASERPAAGAGKQEQGRADGSPVSHGLDGNRDWPITIARGQNPRSPGSASPPELAVTQPPSRGYSPIRTSSRCVSPWCEQLGFNMDDLVSFHKRPSTWSRRGFNSSPSRFRNAVSPYCINNSCYQSTASTMYAYVSVPVVPAPCLESPFHGHACRQYISPAMASPLFDYSSQPSASCRPSLGRADTMPSITPRRSFSVNETQIVF